MLRHYQNFVMQQRIAWKQNWYFAASAFCFLCLYLNGTTIRSFGIQLLCTLLAALVVGCISAALPAGCLNLVKKAGWRNWLLSGLSALGLCQSAYSIFYNLYLPSGLVTAIAGRLSLTSEILLRLAGILGVICGLPAVFVALSLFYAYLARVLQENFRNLLSWEKLLYSVLLIVLFIFTIAAFIKSDCFYSGGFDGNQYNKIYTLDPGIVMERQGSAFLNLRHSISSGYLHTLFAAFAAPFAAIPSLLSLPFPQLPFLKPLLIQGVQLFLLLLTYLMLAQLLNLAPTERAWFLVLCYAAYPTLLFSVTMEKFIIAVFWSVFFLYASQRESTPNYLALTAAGGCVASSVLLLPLSTLSLLRRSLRRWFIKMLQGAAIFLLSFVALGRLDSFLNISSGEFQYFGLEFPLFYRFQQYTAFVSSCFLAPDAGPLLSPETWPAWWMQPIISINLLGLIILMLCVMVFWRYRQEPIAQTAIGWIFISFILLFLCGYDIGENSLVLFSLYFGWAFWILLFLPIRGLRKKSPILATALCCIALCLLLTRNLPQMAALLHFAAETYPAIW